MSSFVLKRINNKGLKLKLLLCKEASWHSYFSSLEVELWSFSDWWNGWRK